MFENLQVFRMAFDMTAHAAARQNVIARNMANADTPGYAARDIAPFQAGTGSEPQAFSLRTTRPSHFGPPKDTAPFAIRDRPGAQADPNGNSVSLEAEMVHAVNTKRQHDKALAIYRSSLDVLRTAIGRR